MSDIVNLTEQASRNFFQWPILLVLKIKRLEAGLAEFGYSPADAEPGVALVDSEEWAVLQALGLPVADNPGAYDLPEREQLAGIRFFFQAAPAFDSETDHILIFVRQSPDSTYTYRELLRTDRADSPYLGKAAARFNQALDGYAIALVLNAAVLWAAFHQAVVLDWQPVSRRLLAAEPELAALPTNESGGSPVEQGGQNGRARRRRISLGSSKFLGDG